MDERMLWSLDRNPDEHLVAQAQDSSLTGGNAYLLISNSSETFISALGPIFDALWSTNSALLWSLIRNFYEQFRCTGAEFASQL